jgi:hypothetical protein
MCVVCLKISYYLVHKLKLAPFLFQFLYFYTVSFPSMLYVTWANWNSYLEGGGWGGGGDFPSRRGFAKSTLFCKVGYVLYSDI